MNRGTMLEGVSPDLATKRQGLTYGYPRAIPLLTIWKLKLLSRSLNLFPRKSVSSGPIQTTPLASVAPTWAVRLTDETCPIPMGRTATNPTGDSIMNPERLRALLLRTKPWDSITDDFSLEEIDPATVDHLLHLAVEKNRLTDVSSNEVSQVIFQQVNAQ